MILGVSDIRIRAGQQAAFDEAIARGASTVIAKAKGFKSFSARSSIESPEPERYLSMRGKLERRFSGSANWLETASYFLRALISSS